MSKYLRARTRNNATEVWCYSVLVPQNRFWAPWDEIHGWENRVINLAPLHYDTMLGGLLECERDEFVLKREEYVRP